MSFIAFPNAGEGAERSEAEEIRTCRRRNPGGVMGVYPLYLTTFGIPPEGGTSRLSEAQRNMRIVFTKPTRAPLRGAGRPQGGLRGAEPSAAEIAVL